MREEPLEKQDDTEEIFSVTNWELAGILVEKLHKEYPHYDFERRSNGRSEFTSIRVAVGLGEKEFHILAGFVFGYFSAIEYLYTVRYSRIEAK